MPIRNVRYAYHIRIKLVLEMKQALQAADKVLVIDDNNVMLN